MTISGDCDLKLKAQFSKSAQHVAYSSLLVKTKEAVDKNKASARTFENWYHISYMGNGVLITTSMKFNSLIFRKVARYVFQILLCPVFLKDA